MPSHNVHVYGSGFVVIGSRLCDVVEYALIVFCGLCFDRACVTHQGHLHCGNAFGGFNKTTEVFGIQKTVVVISTVGVARIIWIGRPLSPGNTIWATLGAEFDSGYCEWCTWHILWQDAVYNVYRSTGSGLSIHKHCFYQVSTAALYAVVGWLCQDF